MDPSQTYRVCPWHFFDSCTLIWDLGLDELRQKHERFLPAEIASIGRNRFGNPFLRDVQLGPTGHLLQGNRRPHLARQARVVESGRVANAFGWDQFEIGPAK